MATTDEQLKELQDEIADKRKLLEEKQRKAAELQRLIQNDQTKGALTKESENLDAALAQADEHLKALEAQSGVTADTIKLAATRGASAQEVPPVKVVAPTPDVTTESVASDSETTTSTTTAKRGK